MAGNDPSTKRPSRAFRLEEIPAAAPLEPRSSASALFVQALTPGVIAALGLPLQQEAIASAADAQSVGQNPAASDGTGADVTATTSLAAAPTSASDPVFASAETGTRAEVGGLGEVDLEPGTGLVVPVATPGVEGSSQAAPTPAAGAADPDASSLSGGGTATGVIAATGVALDEGMNSAAAPTPNGSAPPHFSWPTGGVAGNPDGLTAATDGSQPVDGGQAASTLPGDGTASAADPASRPWTHQGPALGTSRVSARLLPAGLSGLQAGRIGAADGTTTGTSLATSGADASGGVSQAEFPSLTIDTAGASGAGVTGQDVTASAAVGPQPLTMTTSESDASDTGTVSSSYASTSTDAGSTAGAAGVTAADAESTSQVAGTGAVATGSAFFDRPTGEDGGLIARALRLRIGAPYQSAPVGPDPGLRNGGDQAFETIDGLIARYVDYALQHSYSHQGTGDFPVHVTGSDALGGYAFDATVTYNYNETYNNGTFGIADSDSLSYTFYESGHYADGTGFSLSDFGTLTTTITNSQSTGSGSGSGSGGGGTGGGDPSTASGTRIAYGHAGGQHTYAMTEAKVVTYTPSGTACPYSLSLTHAGTDAYGLSESRTEAVATGAVTSGSQTYTWTDTDHDAHTLRLNGSELISSVISLGSQADSATHSATETGTDDPTLSVTATEAFGTAGRLATGTRSFTWDDSGRATATETDSGTLNLIGLAGGSSQTGTYSTSLYHTDQSSLHQVGTDSYTLNGPDSAFSWTVDGTVTYSSGATATETLTSTLSTSLSQASGWVIERNDLTQTHTDYDSGSGTQAYHPRQYGSLALDQGAIVTGAETLTWNSTASDSHSLSQTLRSTSTDRETASLSLAQGTSYQTRSDQATDTSSLISTAPKMTRTLAVTFSEDEGPRGVVTGGAVSIVVHEECQAGIPETDHPHQSLTVDSDYTSSGSSSGTANVGSLTQTEQGTLYDHGHSSSRWDQWSTPTLDSTQTASLGLGSAWTGGTLFETLGDGGTENSWSSATGTETIGTTDTLADRFGGGWSSATLADTTTGTYTLSDSLAERYGEGRTATETLGLGGTITGGFAVSASSATITHADTWRTETGTETGSTWSSATDREGGDYADSSESGTIQGRFTDSLTGTYATATDSPANRTGSGTFTYGLAGVLTAGTTTLNYTEPASLGWTDQLRSSSTRTVTTSDSAHVTSTEGGDWTSHLESGGATQYYTEGASQTIGHWSTGGTTQTRGFNDLVSSGASNSSYLEQGQRDASSSTLTLITTSASADTLTSTLSGVSDTGSSTGHSTSTLIEVNSNPTYSHTLSQTLSQVLGVGGAVQSGVQTSSYLEGGSLSWSSQSLSQHGDEHPSPVGSTQVGADSYTSSSNLNQSYGSELTQTISSLTYGDTESYSVNLGLGGSITDGTLLTTLSSNSASSSLNLVESSSETGWLSGTSAQADGGNATGGSLTESLAHQDILAHQTYSSFSAYSTGTATLGTNGAFTKGHDESTVQEQARLDSLSLGVTDTVASTYSAYDSALLDGALSRTDQTLTNTLTTTYGTSYCNTTLGLGTTLFATSREDSGTGGTVTSGFRGATYNDNGTTGGYTTDVRGSFTSRLTGTSSLKESGESSQSSNSLTQSGTVTSYESLGYSSTDVGHQNLTLGTNGSVTSGESSDSRTENATTYTLSFHQGGSQNIAQTARRDVSAAGQDLWADSNHNVTNGSFGVTVVRQNGTIGGRPALSASSTTTTLRVGPGGSITDGSQTSRSDSSEVDYETITESGTDTSTIRDGSFVDVHASRTTTLNFDVTQTQTCSDTVTNESSSVSFTTGGTIASGGGQYQHDQTLYSGVHATYTLGTQSVVDQGVSKTGSYSMGYSQGDSSTLSESGWLTYGQKGAITSGTLSYQVWDTLTDSYGQDLYAGSAAYQDLVGGPALTGSASDHYEGSDTLTQYESGFQAMGQSGTISGGNDSFSWDQRGGTSARVTVGAAGTPLYYDESNTDSFWQHETGTETLGANGTITSGSDGYTWEQGGIDSYSLHMVGGNGAQARSYTMDYGSSVSTSWHDQGHDTLGTSDAIAGGDDSYTFAQQQSSTYGVSDSSVDVFGRSLVQQGTGFWSFSLHQEGDNAWSKRTGGGSGSGSGSGSGGSGSGGSGGSGGGSSSGSGGGGGAGSTGNIIIRQNDTVTLKECSGNAGALTQIDHASAGRDVTISGSGVDSYNLTDTITSNYSSDSLGTHAAAYNAFTLDNYRHNNCSAHELLSSVGSNVSLSDEHHDDYSLHASGTNTKTAATDTSVLGFSATEQASGSFALSHSGDLTNPADHYDLYLSNSDSLSSTDQGTYTSTQGNRGYEITHDVLTSNTSDQHGSDALGSGVFGSAGSSTASTHYREVNNLSTYTFADYLYVFSGGYTTYAGWSGCDMSALWDAQMTSEPGRTADLAGPSPREPGPLGLLDYWASRATMGSSGATDNRNDRVQLKTSMADRTVSLEDSRVGMALDAPRAATGYGRDGNSGTSRGSGNVYGYTAMAGYEASGWTRLNPVAPGVQGPAPSRAVKAPTNPFAPAQNVSATQADPTSVAAAAAGDNKGCWLWRNTIGAIMEEGRDLGDKVGSAYGELVYGNPGAAIDLAVRRQESVFREAAELPPASVPQRSVDQLVLDRRSAAFRGLKENVDYAGTIVEGGMAAAQLYSDVTDIVGIGRALKDMARGAALRSEARAAGTGAFVGVHGPSGPGAFRSEADLLQAKLGPARLSHPEEFAGTLRQLEEAGVEIEYRTGSWAYTPERGGPGKLILDPDASLGALRHEFKHFADVRDAGYPGLGRYLGDPQEFARLEVRGYMEEVRLARELGHHDVVPNILQQMRDRVGQLLGK